VLSAVEINSVAGLLFKYNITASVNRNAEKVRTQEDRREPVVDLVFTLQLVQNPTQSELYSNTASA
jgi:hypothetical protein